jgi:hypothetical protein
MKKIFYVLILITLTSCASLTIINNGKCQYQEYGYDEFSKNSKIKTFYQTFTKNNYSGFSLKASGTKINTTSFLSISLFSHKAAFNLYQDNYLILLEENGSVLKLKIPETKTSGIFMNTSFYATQNFKLTENDIKELKTKTFIKARYQVSEGYIDFIISKNHQNVFKDAMRCINN